MNIDIDKLLSCAKGLADTKILVVGDLALDEMIYGDTERKFTEVSDGSYVAKDLNGNGIVDEGEIYDAMWDKLW